MFCGVFRLFRYSELAQLKESDVVIYPEHMELFVEASKTGQFRDSAWVVIARTQFKLCPVAISLGYPENCKEGLGDRLRWKYTLRNVINS